VGAWAGSAAAEVRAAKVAGQFYPDEPAELRALVQELLDRQPEPVIAKRPRALIVPHAGYQYSGLIAANAYRQLQGHRYDGVVVVGFTHRMRFDGSSVETREAVQTPLGEIPVDQEAAAILQSFPGITHDEAAHESPEHSLEVQLPFLQVVLPRFRLVPMLMGGATREEASRLAEALAALSRFRDYLFVFSTDLSHYHPYDEAETLDERTIDAILHETPQAVDQLFDRGELEACGRGPIVASLFLADRLGYLSRTLFTHANSGDTWVGTQASVVGYAALGMFDRPAQASARLSPEAGAALVAGARQTLQASLGQGGSSPAPSLARQQELARASGLFVTLRKSGQLRGCMGRIQTAEPLASSLPAVALEAALQDPRFNPVTSEELPQLHVEVSVLTTPAKLARLEDLVPGRDGVILEHGGRRGVFLPQVWEETGWTRLEFLRELASQKAGLAPDAWQQATLYVFQDQIFAE